MSNIAKVIEFITAEPNFVKEEMISKIMATLNVTRPNAQVYIFNAKRKMDAPETVKTKAKSSTAPVKEVKIKTVKAARKTEYLPGQTSQESRKAPGKSKTRDQVLGDMAKIEADADEYEQTTVPSKTGLYRMPKSDEEIARIKEDRLAMMKEVTKRHKALQAQERKDEEQEEIAKYEDEADSYVEYLKADFKRGKLSIATAD